MFSGIIEQVGQVVAVHRKGAGIELTMQSSLPVAAAGKAGVGTANRTEIGLGDSIAINGVCLTVEKVTPPNRFTVVCGLETVNTSTFANISVGGKVQLERALRLGDPLDGHLVSGHIDGVGVISQISKELESTVIWLSASPSILRYIAKKGSIAIDGISLTVNEVDDIAGTFRVNIIPFTTDHTLVNGYRAGSRVNLEVDMIARYVERLVSPQSGGLTKSRLVELGFVAAKGGQ